MDRTALMRERMERWIENQVFVPEHFAPDFVRDMSHADWPGAVEYHGHEGLRQFFAEWLGPWEGWTYELEDVVEGTNDSVVVVGVQRAVNRAGGVPVEMRMGQVWTIDDAGRATRMEMYTDAASGLAAAGAVRSGRSDG